MWWVCRLLCNHRYRNRLTWRVFGATFWARSLSSASVEPTNVGSLLLGFFFDLFWWKRRTRLKAKRVDSSLLERTKRQDHRPIRRQTTGSRLLLLVSNESEWVGEREKKKVDGPLTLRVCLNSFNRQAAATAESSVKNRRPKSKSNEWVEPSSADVAWRPCMCV